MGISVRMGPIAADLAKTPDAVRMTWNRASKRLVAQGIVRPA